MIPARSALIASIGGAPEAVAASLARLDRRADLIELRLDRVPRGQVAGLVAAAPKPVIAACRGRADGGAYEGDEQERVARLREAARAGAQWVDLEWGSQAARRPLAFSPARIVLSWHDFSETPGDLPERLRAMRGTPGVSLVKIVTTARRLGDLLRLRELLRGQEALSAFAMGPAGAASRILAPVWGSAASYAAAGEEPTAPGQLRVAEMLDRYRFRELGPRTRVAALLGRPLAHSLSPRLHNLGYAACGLDWVYVPCESESVEDLRELMEGADIAGASVTIPHKEAVLPLLDEVDPEARRIGAVNTIVRQGGRLRGTNTDAEAALAPLREAIRTLLQGARAPTGGRAPAQGGAAAAGRRKSSGGGDGGSGPLRVALLGAGGAARALAFGLTREGHRVRIFNRTAERARRLAAECGAEWGEWRELEREPYDLLVNATSAGMHPRREEAPIPEEWLRGSLVYDIVYNPAETALLRAARRRGIAGLGGAAMFLGQAAAQFRLFTGAEPPLDAWRAALEEALAEGAR
jgi:3-dehydroquinate dehydratase/shikimate dehydrogenase